jgi:hypothetical protein
MGGAGNRARVPSATNPMPARVYTGIAQVGAARDVHYGGIVACLSERLNPRDPNREHRAPRGTPFAARSGGRDLRHLAPIEDLGEHGVRAALRAEVVTRERVLVLRSS